VEAGSCFGDVVIRVPNSGPAEFDRSSDPGEQRRRFGYCGTVDELLRLNDLGYLKKLSRVSIVSGGSIMAICGFRSLPSPTNCNIGRNNLGSRLRHRLRLVRMNISCESACAKVSSCIAWDGAAKPPPCAPVAPTTAMIFFPQFRCSLLELPPFDLHP